MTTDQVLAAMRSAVAAGGTSEDVLAAARRAAARTAGGPAPDPPPASTAYHAIDGDVLDAVAYAAYGAEYAVTTLLAANPQIVDYYRSSSPLLFAGEIIGLPPIDPPAPESRPVQIWD